MRRNRARFPADCIFELASNRQLAIKFALLERKVSRHDRAIVDIIKAIRELMHPPAPKKRPIGFTANLDE